jgi:Trk K+ transport system NAD-binding subunit
MPRRTPPPDFEGAPRVGSLIFWHFARRFAPWLAALAGYLVLATIVVRWDMTRGGEQPLDFGAELYGMYTQLFFEPTQNLPQSTVARVVFWITPLLGAVLLARGVVRVGASLFDVEERRRLWVKVMSDGMKDHIVVCGLGHVGVRVVEALKELGAPVVAIEKTQADSFGTVIESLGVPVHYGDARRDELLVRAGIRRAKAVVCATDDDLTNLEIAIDARRENPKIRVVMRMFDKRVAGKIGSALHLDETFSTSALAGPLVALQATEAGVRGVYRLEDGSLRVNLETLPPEGWRGRTVASCEDEIEGRIVGLRRGERFLRPRHDTKIEEGDHLTLDLPAGNLGRVRARAPRAP